MLLYYFSLPTNRHVRTSTHAHVSVGQLDDFLWNTTEKLQGLWRDGGQPQPGLQRSISTRGRRGPAAGYGSWDWGFPLGSLVWGRKFALPKDSFGPHGNMYIYIHLLWTYLYQCWKIKCFPGGGFDWWMTFDVQYIFLSKTCNFYSPQSWMKRLLFASLRFFPQ